MLSRWSVASLATVSTIGGIFAVFSAKGEDNIKAKQLEKQSYCQESIKMLKNHEGAKYILGQGFVVKTLKDVEDDYKDIRFYFPVVGRDGKGKFTIYSKCQMNDAETNGRTCHVDKSFLEVDECKTLEEEKYKGKQLIIYDRIKHGPMKYECEEIVP